MAVLLLLAVLCLAGFVSASADGEGYVLQLSNVETQLRADGEQLVINGTVNGPENVAEILIAGWMDNEPSASEALENAQLMTEVWKEDYSSFPEQELPFVFGVGRPVEEEDRGKTQYIILAGLDTGVNLVGYEVIRVELSEQTEIPTLTLSVSPENPSLGEPVTVSWVNGYENPQDVYLDIMLYSGRMTKLIDTSSVDLYAKSGSITFTPTAGEYFDATMYFWAPNYVYKSSGRINLSGDWDPPEAFAIDVTYEEDTQHQITANYQITGGAGSYSRIKATLLRHTDTGIPVWMYERKLEFPTGQMTFSPPLSGKYVLQFLVEDSDGWTYEQAVNEINSSITVSEIPQQDLGIAFLDELPDMLTRDQSELTFSWDVIGGGTGDNRATHVHIATDDGIELIDDSFWGFTKTLQPDLSAIGDSSQSLIISLTPKEGTTTGETVTRTIPIEQISGPEPVLEPAVIELPGGVEFPSLEECKAFDGWDAVTIEEGAAVFTVDPRKNMPYKVIVQYIGTQRPGAGLVVQVSGTDADPRADKESPTTYNALQFHYWEGDTNPSMGWMTTSYGRVGNLFDNAWLSVYYGWDYHSLRDGHAMLGIHGEYIQVDYWYGWEITDEVRTALSADGLLEERLAWLNAWQPKPLTIQLTAPLSIRDLMVKAKVLRLPANLKEIESEAFIGVDVDRIIIPPTVETIADDAFDDDILLILPSDSLEDWARTHHPSYIIDRK